MAVKAIVQLHERSTTTALEADLQLRELGLDAQTNSLTVSSELDSTKWHIITKEHTAPSLDNALMLSSTLTVVGAATLAALSATTGAFSGAVTLGATLRFNNANNLQWQNLSGTTRNILALNASNNLEINGTGDGGINFYYGTGNNAGTISNSGAWAIPGTFTLSALSSGRVPIVSTGGLITQDNLYWDSTNDLLGIGAAANYPLDVAGATAGTTRVARIYHSDSADSASHARLQIQTGGASGGDPYIDFQNGVTEYTLGMDNSDGDAFVLSEASTLGTNNRLRISSTQLRSYGNLQIDGTSTLTGNLTLSTLSSGRIPVVSTSGLIIQDNLYWDATNDRLGVGSGASSPASIIDATESNSGTSTLRLVNSNSAATGGALLLLSSNGASGGDSYVNFNINGVTNWAVGADNSDSDAFVITPATTLGGATNGLRISTAGAVTIPGSLGVTGAFSSAGQASFTTTGVDVNGTTANRGMAWFGVSSGAQIQIDANDIQAMNNTSTATLWLNGFGGLTRVGAAFQASDGASTFAGITATTVAFSSSLTNTGVLAVGAGGSDWTNEVSLDATGVSVIEITPTGASQTYKITNPTSRQSLMIINKSTYNVYVDLNDGTGTDSAYIYADSMMVCHYNGTKWYSTTA